MKLLKISKLVACSSSTLETFTVSFSHLELCEVIIHTQKRESYCSSIFLSFSSGSGSFFGAIISRTPLFIVACTFDGSTSSGKLIVLLLEEYVRSL